MKKNLTSYRVFLAGTVLAAAAWATAIAADKPAEAKPLTVDEIVAKTNATAYYQGADGRAKVSMKIVDAEKRERTREFTVLRWDQGDPAAKKETPAEKSKSPYTGEQKFFIYFDRPADVNKMVFLVHKHLDKDDDRWLYLPALDLVKRIAATDKRTSFVGSHFLYEDVSGRNVNDDTHELVEAETNDTYYVLKNTPKNAKSVEFGSFKMWIHRKTFVVVQTSYYDKEGKEYRRYNALSVKHIQERPTVTKSRMTDMRTKAYTELEYKDVTYDVGTPEDVFTERYLRNAPRKYLK
jgi:hypothetical protein